MSISLPNKPAQYFKYFIALVIVASGISIDGFSADLQNITAETEPESENLMPGNVNTISVVENIHVNNTLHTDSLATHCLISLWNHMRELAESGFVEELTARLGVNHVWSHDPNYTGQAWDDTHMKMLLDIPGISQVMAKVERAAWGWDMDMSLRHARWVAIMSQMYPGITGMYLNDFYDEIEDGIRTEDEWREIIAAAKDINPGLMLWVPHYPHRDQGRHDFDFDIDGVILNLWGNDPELIARGPEHLAAGLSHHPDRPVIAGLYLRAGPDGGRWLEENEFRTLLSHYVDLLNEGYIQGLRMFAAYQFQERPEYIDWAEEILEGVTCR